MNKYRIGVIFINLINLYIGDFNYDSNFRPFLVDILKPFFPEKNLEKYHLTHIAFEIVQNRNESVFFLLPFCWNYYVETDTISVAERFIEEARENGKKILIWVTGDYYFPIPQFDNIIGFYTSPYKSMQNVKTNALPVIITDPLLLIGRGSIEIQQYNSTPSIGFCGQSDPNLIVSSIKFIDLLWQEIKYFLHLSRYYSGPIIPPTHLRKKVLDILEKTQNIKTKFIRRNQYQGGAPKNKEEFQIIRNEFYQNINGMNYTVCIRGTGNFSARFYETLALGRIPIFINTDCLLPFKDIIDWGKHVVFIEQNEISNISSKILEFHSHLSKDSFENIQKNNRLLWEEYFSFPGFIKQLSYSVKKELN